MLDLSMFAQPSAALFVGMWVVASGPDKGRIRSRVECERGMEGEQVRENSRLVEGFYDTHTTYIDDDDLAVARPKITEDTEFHIKADGVDEVVISAPNGTEVQNERRAVVGYITDGSFEFSTTIPETYNYTFIPPFPYQEQTIKVVANAN